MSYIHESEDNIFRKNKEALQTVLQLLEQEDNKIKELEYKYNKALTDLVKAEKENEELRKGQQSLMQSRKKWKDRYYKLKRDFDYIQHEHDRLDKRNNELSEDITTLAKYSLDGCIPKSVIQDKIKELGISDTDILIRYTLEEILKEE